MAEHRPLGPRQEFGDHGLHLDRLLERRPTEPAHQAAEVRVHRQPRHTEGVAEHDVRRLAAEARQGEELGKASRNLATVPLHQGGTEPDQAARLVAEEAGRTDHRLEPGPVGTGIIRRRRVAAEQRRRDLVDPLVGALRRQDRRDRQLERRPEVQLAMRVRVQLGERAGDPTGPSGPRQRAGRGLARPPDTDHCSTLCRAQTGGLPLRRAGDAPQEPQAP